MNKLLIFLGIVVILIVSVVDSHPFRRSKPKYTRIKETSQISGTFVYNYLYVKDGVYEVVNVRKGDPRPDPNWLSRGFLLRDDFNQSGWYVLEIETSDAFNDSSQAIAAGYLEAYMSRDLIELTLNNTVGTYCDDPTDKVCNELKSWLDQNFVWMQNQIQTNPNDPYWHQVELILDQLSGLGHGYYGNKKLLYKNKDTFTKFIHEPQYFKLLLLQITAELFELLSALQGTVDPFWAGSCSAMIKVLENNSDLYVAHDTWSEFNTMLRVLKHYKLKYSLNNIDPIAIPGGEISLSSYPGTLLSVDDFYLTKSDLAIIETTIGNSNPDLWKYVTPETNLYWIRNLVANRLAFTGVDWAKLFTLHNSGTYNNEWMVVDYKLFTPGESLKDNLFIVLEQLPGLVVWSDKTDVLRNQSYWPSYNIPYYPEVFNLSGAMDSYLQYGDIFSYANTSRARIFKREQSSVQDINSMIRVMRFNNFTTDPLSTCDCNPAYSAELTIAARSDLNPSNGTYPLDFLGHRQHGAIDMKMTSYSMIKNLEFIAIYGPTFNENVPPFVWSESDFNDKVPHYGLPDKYQYDPYHVKWNL